MKLQTRGGRNLALLGIGAILIATATTSVGLFVYRSSGDIYLDRSRPGYLPDPEEVKEEQNTNPTYSYPDNGPLDKAELKTYLEELEKVNDRLKALADPYSPDPLSDESLGIAPTSPDQKTSNSHEAKQ